MTFEYDGVNIHLIDTPGLNDTIRSDGEVLMMIATYLLAMYNSKIRLDGIVYMFPITSNRMTGSAVKDLNLFSKMVGDEALSEVVLVTSMWDLVDSNLAEIREKELSKRFWKHLIANGSKVCRVDHQRFMALPVLDVLLRGDQAPGKVLQIQRELVDDMKTLGETQAGQQFLKETRELQDQFRRNLEQLKGELDDAIAARDVDMEKNLREEQARFERRISQAENESRALQVGFERLVREKEYERAPLISQIDTERREIAFSTRELQIEVEALRAQLQQNKGKCSHG